MERLAEGSPEVTDPAAEPSMSPGAFAPAEERLFQETRALWRAPPAGLRKAISWFLVSLGFYVLYRYSFAEDDAGSLPAGIALLVGVLLLHELGHLAGMRLFGYRDLRILFIPFFGAAAIGRKDAAPIWQQAIMVLLGPLPGIVLAGILQLALQPAPGTFLHEAVLLLVVLNLFNLLPLVPLDGGRFLELVVFSRTPLLEAGFGLLAYLGLGALGMMLKSPLLGVLAVLGALGLPVRFRQSRRRALLRPELTDLPARVEDLSEAEERTLFRLARAIAPESARPSYCVRQIRLLHGAVTVRPPSLPATTGLLILYVVAFFAGLAALVLVATGNFDEDLDAARKLAGHLERFHDDSQRLIASAQELEKERRAFPEAPVRRREEQRLRQELGRLVDEALARLEAADPAVRSLALDGEENVPVVFAWLRRMKDDLAAGKPLAAGLDPDAAEETAKPEDGKSSR